MKKAIAFILASTDHGTLIINRNDFHQNQYGTYGVGAQLLSQSSFDQDEVDIVKKLLFLRKECHGSGVLALDLGANIGVHSVEWGRLMSDWGHVISFEAQERIFYSLAGNININNLFNVRAIWAAVGATNGHINVPVPDYSKPSSFGSLEIKKKENNEYIGQHIDYEKAILTKMVCIDDFEFSRVDFIKIDIEGMELEALEGAKFTIGKCKPILLIEKIKSDERKILEYLENYDYAVYPLGINLLAVNKGDPCIQSISIT